MSIIPKTSNNKKLAATLFSRIAKLILLKQLKAIKLGTLTLHDGDSTYQFGVQGNRNYPDAVIHIHDQRLFSSILLEGEPAAGKSYVDGWWSSDQLVDVLSLFSLNQNTLFKFKYGLGMLAKYYNYLVSLIKKNTPTGSKKNILAHYDIGNDFYSLFLDSKMMYSSAYYQKTSDDLEQASENKLRLICEKLKLKADDQVIEIGSGWGGFAIYAAQNYACHVTTTTISDAQYNYAKAHIEQLGLQDRITLIQQDYRKLEGQYDKLVSIEMIEAVGHQFLDGYFKVCDRLLKPHGAMLVQAITIADYLHSEYIYSVDFIRKYVFPGGCLTSMNAMLASVTKGTTLTPYHAESFASSYGRTLHDWHQRFMSAKQQVYALGYNDELIRLWEYYLKYCQAGFETRVIDVQQLVLKKPDNRFCHET